MRSKTSVNKKRKKMKKNRSPFFTFNKDGSVSIGDGVSWLQIEITGGGSGAPTSRQTFHLGKKPAISSDQ